ncbi:MAG: selenide, water dikinase SelD, partial [Burkholderiales bacterium]
AKQGFGSGAIGRNWAGYGKEVILPEAMPEWQKNLLCDPQTSGGLLVACSEDAAEKVLQLFHKQEFRYAAKIGRLAQGAATVTVR